MSETLNVAEPGQDQGAAGTNQKRGRLVKEPPQDLAVWRDEMYAELSWASKQGKQAALAGIFANVCSAADGLMQPRGENSAAALEAKQLGPGQEFKGFLKELKAFEACGDDAAREKAAGPLRDAAQKYIKHWEGHGDARKTSGAPAQKKAACDQALADLKRVERAMQARELGSPPWDSAGESKALGLKATLDFESLPNAKGAAEMVGGDHANTAFWVNAARAGGDPTQRDKTFIFKPPEPKGNVDGYPPGGDIGREALTARLGDVVRGLTGFDLQLPETNIVQLDRDNFPADRLPGPPAGDTSGRIKGSLQQFAAGTGDLQSMPEAERAKVPQKACEKIVIIDMLSLNTDRHSGNMMVGQDAAGQTTLIPIDHGRAFPNREGMNQVVNHLGGRHSAILRLPGAHQPFSPEAVQGLSQLQGDVMAGALRKERRTITALDKTAGAALSDDSIDMSRRAADFLRLAVQATPPITAAAAQVALATNSESLFDPTLDSAGFEALATSIIARAVEQQDGLKQLMTLNKFDYAELTESLKKAGFTIGDGEEIKSQTQVTYPKELMLAFRAGIKATPPIQFASGAAYRPGETGERFTSGYTSTMKKVEALGGNAALAAAINRLGIAGKQAERAKADPATALEVITMANALDNVAQQVAGIDLDVKDVERALRRLDGVAGDLEEGSRLLADVRYLKEQENDGSEDLRKEVEKTFNETVAFLTRKYQPIVAGLKIQATALLQTEKSRPRTERNPNKANGYEELENLCDKVMETIRNDALGNIKDTCAKMAADLSRIQAMPDQ